MSTLNSNLVTICLINVRFETDIATLPPLHAAGTAWGTNYPGELSHLPDVHPHWKCTQQTRWMWWITSEKRGSSWAGVPTCTHQGCRSVVRPTDVTWDWAYYATTKKKKLNIVGTSIAPLHILTVKRKHHKLKKKKISHWDKKTCMLCL